MGGGGKHILTGTLVALLASTPAAHTGDLEVALETYRQGRFDESYRLLQPLAQSGNLDAQVNLGRMYHFGEGVEVNNARAYELLLAPGRAGKPEAQFLLGSMFLYGDLTPEGDEDPDVVAARWIIEAAVRGHAESQYILGLLLFAGTGVVQDPEEAIIWIEKAASGGHMEARAFLGLDP